MSRQLEEFDREMLTYLRGGHVDWPSNLRNSMTGDLLTDHHRLLATRYNLFGPNILPAELSREAIEQHAWGRARRSGQQDLIAGFPSCEMHPTLRRVLGGGVGDYGPRHRSYELYPYHRGRSRDVNELVVRRRSRSRHRSHSRHHHHHSHHHDHHHRSASAHRRLTEERYAADRNRQQEINVQAELLRRANEVRDARRREADFERMRTEQMAVYEREARDRDAWVSGQRRRVNDRIREYNTLTTGYRQAQHDIQGSRMDRLRSDADRFDFNYGPVTSARDIDVGLMDNVFGRRITDRVVDDLYPRGRSSGRRGGDYHEIDDFMYDEY